MNLKEYRHKRTQKHVRRFLRKLGFDVQQLDPEITQRLTLLEETTPTIHDEKRAIRYARKIFRHYQKKHPEHAFSEEEKMTVEAGTMLTDIGKSGPPHADRQAEKLIAEMFSIEGVEDPNMSIRTFLQNYFPETWRQHIKTLESIALGPEMTMRQFWNKHSEWTHKIIENKGVPEEAIPAASTHHRLEGVNPDNIIGTHDTYRRPFGTNTTFDRAEKLIIVLDKYDAYRRRGGTSHRDAMAALRNIITESPYGDDAEFHELMDELDAVLSKKHGN